MEIHGTGLATQGFESPRLQTSPELVTFELQIKGRSLSDEASWPVRRSLPESRRWSEVGSVKRQGVVGLSLLPRDAPVRVDSGRLRLAATDCVPRHSHSFFCFFAHPQQPFLED
jgi:hypothetical protein